MGLTQDNLIKLVFLLQGDAQKEMDRISATDADFAVQNQAKIRDVLALTQTFLEAAKLKDYFNSGNRSGPAPRRVPGKPTTRDRR